MKLALDYRNSEWTLNKRIKAIASEERTFKENGRRTKGNKQNYLMLEVVSQFLPVRYPLHEQELQIVPQNSGLNRIRAVHHQ